MGLNLGGSKIEKLLIELSSIETTNTLQPLNHPLLF